MFRPKADLSEDVTLRIPGASDHRSELMLITLAGFSNAAGVSVSNTFNSRLQPWEVSAARSGSKILDLVYDFHLGSGDTGDVYQISNQLDGSRTQYFAYDQLGRLLQAQTSLTWGNSYQYDPWGNLLQMNFVANTQSGEYLQKQVGVDNRFLGEVYDAAGNLTRGLYAYDGENRLVNAGGIGYTYYADGRRVQKQNGPVYWYGAQGEVLAESDASGAITNEYVFFGGRRIARRDSNGNSFYYLEDHLGTARKITTSDGVCYDADYSPYGAEHVYVDTCPQHYKFTGKERDGETGLDYFGARYYGSNMARFLSPDEFTGGPMDLFGPNPNDVGPLPYADITNPQSLNKYAYTYNNPLRYTDPDGHCIEDACILETAAVAALFAYTASPQGQQVIRDGLNALGSMASSVGSRISSWSKAIPNPWGAKGAPDHQDKVKEEADKAQAEAQAGESVLVGQKVKGIDSHRRPDVQVVGADGKTKTVVEVERKPHSARHNDRSKEYSRNKIPQKTVPLKNKKAPRPSRPEPEAR